MATQLLLEQNIVVAYIFLELYFYVIFISFSVLIGKNEVIKISDFGTSRQWSEHSTKMSFAGLKKPEERAALIRWLRDQADAPIALPQ